MALNNNSFSKMAYWQGFISFMSSGENGDKIRQNGLNLPKVNDYNWYPIRFGNARANIEHSFNTKNNTLRASLIIQNDPDLFHRIEADKAEVEAMLTRHGGAVQWDGVSKAMHINVLVGGQDVTDPRAHSTQYAWFAALTFLLKDLVDTYDKGGAVRPAPKPVAQPRMSEVKPQPQAAPAPSVQKAAPPKAPAPAPKAQAPVIDLDRRQQIMDLMADFFGLSTEASRYKDGSKEMWAKRDEQKEIISKLQAITKDPVCNKNIWAAHSEMESSDKYWPLIDLLVNLDVFTTANLYYLVFSLQETFHALEVLLEGGGKKAAYYLARCYGSGLIGKNKNGDLFVLKPDADQTIKYYAEAVKADVYQAELETGCLALAHHEDDAARVAFQLALSHGVQEAAIYLNYMNNYPDRETVYAPYYTMGERNASDTKSLCGCNCIEYKGYLYYVEVADYGEKSALYRINTSNGQKQQLLKFAANSQMRRGDYPLNATQIFSIARDRIFLPIGEPDAIVMMELDGSNPCYLKNLRASGRHDILTRAYAFDNFMIYQKGSSTLYRYDYRTANSTKLIQFSGEITGVSEKEIIFDNKRVLKLDTLQKMSIQSLYPALKGKSDEDIILVDCAREIAYYRDQAQEKVFGTDKAGRIVDIWNMPRLHWSDPEQWWYDTHCFNGTRWTCKYGYASVTKDARRGSVSNGPVFLPQIMASFDRNGNMVVVHEHQERSEKDQYPFGQFHTMTAHFDMVLRYHTDHHHWNMAFNMYQPGSFIPLCKFY